MPDTPYGTYNVAGHGVVTLDRKRAKAFVGNKLSHERKPSSYFKTKEVCIIIMHIYLFRANAE